MSLLANLTTSTDIEDEKDVVGGGYTPLESALYPATIRLAYLEKSSGGALSLVLNLETDAKREIRQTLWMTSGNAKGNLNYFVNKDGEKRYLPGFTHANALALLTIGKEISQLEPEKKVINLYNKEAKGEVPTTVEMLTELLGQEILVGVIKQIVDKTAKDDAGNYVPTGETREENEIDKFFRARDRKTTAEIRASKDAVFADTWAAKWNGKTKDKSTKSKSAGGVAGAPKAAANAANNKPTTSLFG